MARSGGKDERWAGISDEQELRNYAVYRVPRTEPVGSRKPNGLGLYDMSGNVGEWIEDCWHETYDDAPKDGSAWREESGGDCSYQMYRGGSWADSSGFLETTSRYWEPGPRPERDSTVGFRLAQDIDEP